MGISSTGVGSGLDVKSIVSQLVAIEKQPLQDLQTRASKFQTQLSLYGTVKSQVSTLENAARLLSGASGWNSQTATSSNAAAVGVTVGATASSAALTVSVQQLAQAQSTASVGIAAGSAAGATGSLSIQLGSWSGAAFTAGAGASVAVTVSATDTVSAIASKINAAGAGVTASVLSDGTTERLIVQSSGSGTAAGFNITATGDAALSAYGFTDAVATSASAAGMFMGQSGLDAKLTVNGVALVSGTNNMTNVTPGVSLNLLQTTTAPVGISVQNDLSAVTKNIQSFVDAYNALNTTLSDATKYTAATKTGGPLQGDATTVGLQTALRAMLGSTSAGSTFSYLSDVGIERQTDGSLKINTTKLTSAQQNLPNLKNLFTADNGNAATNGFALKVRDFSHGLLAFDGAIISKSTALQGSISRNSSDQTRVSDRATRIEAQLYRQYSALDAQMAQLNSLSSYVTSQIAQWNKSSG